MGGGKGHSIHSLCRTYTDTGAVIDTGAVVDTGADTHAVADTETGAETDAGSVKWTYAAQTGDQSNTTACNDHFPLPNPILYLGDTLCSCEAYGMKPRYKEKKGGGGGGVCPAISQTAAPELIPARYSSQPSPASPRALSEHCDARVVPSKHRGIVRNPLQRQSLVLEAEVT